jgi:IS30 family transposase
MRMGSHYQHLSMDERNTIHQRRLEGASLRAIARELNRPASDGGAGNRAKSVRHDL